MTKLAEKKKKILCLFMALLFIFLTAGSVIALADDENTTITIEPSLTNGLFKNDSCSEILSTSFNRAALTVLLYLDLVEKDLLDISDLADTVVNSYVGKPNHDSISNYSVVVSMYNSKSIYLITYTPLLGQANFNAIDNNQISDSLIEALFDTVTINNQKNSVSDILEVMKAIQEAIKK